MSISDKAPQIPYTGPPVLQSRKTYVGLPTNYYIVQWREKYSA